MKIEPLTDSEGKLHHYEFFCNGCSLYHSFRVALAKNERRDAPVWKFNGDVENPTFSPSLLVTLRDTPTGSGKTAKCHLHLRNGQLQYLSDCTHDLAGTTVPVQAEPDENTHELIGDADLRTAVLLMHDELEPKMREEPAAKRKHHSWPCGYYTHIEQVVHLGIKIRTTLAETGCPVPPLDDVILVCFIHDLDKLIRYRHIDPTRQDLTTPIDHWGQQVSPPEPTYEFIDRPPFESSGYVAVECARYGIFLTLDQLHAVSCHHGGWAPLLASVYSRDASLSPLATIVHCADLCSARMWGEHPG